ncbi:enoyl-CoA hydratase/isomerase family protein [Blastococcus mobilis]|uniref:enoyl-CoA hydratase/isomerase family protein n=1 Tax=Blastococcus mobilis TaxID=1938746 RepID=UPI0020CB9F39|nr:enoyl-CoA hydratase/isomerase family protein [Blastococcus mobilis]
MAGSGEVLLGVDGGVAVVTLNAPDRRNALTPAMVDELIATFDEVDAKPQVGALVVRAEGKSFCAGGDIATLTSAGKDPAAPEAYEGMGKIYDSFYRLGQVKVPTVAAVRGSAVGAGMNMLLATDLRIVAKDARLFAGFLKRGMHPGGGHFVIPVAPDRPRGRGGDGVLRRGDQRRQGRGARPGVGVGGQRRGGGPGAGAGCSGCGGPGAGAGGGRQLPQGSRQRRRRLGRRHAVRAPRPDVVDAPLGSGLTEARRSPGCGG